MQSQNNGKPTSRNLKVKLSVLLLTSALLVSGCASNSQTPKCVASRVTVDPSLMVKPSYTQELLNFLSDSPSEQTPK